jgi:ABC-type glycerol-3-phosphate transport system substrate-binding protein
MKKTAKRVVALMLAMIMVMSMVACKKKEDPKTTTAPGGEVTKPTKITVMWDNTIVAEDNGGVEFAKELEKALGMTIEFKRPVHSAYYDVLSTAFVSEDVPDVFVLAANYYAQYASQGYLWNMETAWNNSDLKKSGRLEQWAIDMIAGLKTSGLADEQGIYGFNLTRGNGCVTYVRTAWLEACGLAADGSSIKTYQDYYNMCVAFKEKYNVAPVTASKYLNGEAPYTNYLPEFYQGAYPDFYETASGKWVDGFSEQAMKDALKRLQDANNAGLLDPDMGTNTTTNARDGFYAEEHGVFTYWAGTWAQTIVDKLAAAGVADTRVTALKPIAEVGKYVERQAPVVAISSKCSNPEGVFKYFIEPIYDGAEVQALWTYGVKGTHWDDKAETITLKNKDYVYAANEFHFLLDPATKSSFMKKNHIDPLLQMGKFIEGKDPAATAKSPIVSPKALEVMSMFNVNCKNAPVIISTTTITENSAKIWEKRNELVTKIVAQNMNVDDAMAEYQSAVGAEVKKCLESLNDL